jgi:hypothetical protein
MNTGMFSCNGGLAGLPIGVTYRTHFHASANRTPLRKETGYRLRLASDDYDYEVYQYFFFLSHSRGLDTSVGTARVCGLDVQSLIPGSGKKLFCFAQRRYRLWSPLNLLSKGTWSRFPEGKNPGA